MARSISHDHERNSVVCYRTLRAFSTLKSRPLWTLNNLAQPLYPVYERVLVIIKLHHFGSIAGPPPPGAPGGPPFMNINPMLSMPVMQGGPPPLARPPMVGL
eukprot:1195948-Prorocentrum_minimum.AAC.6